jgi:hypothetical protein
MRLPRVVYSFDFALDRLEWRRDSSHSAQNDTRDVVEEFISA